jgi:hypothetical protein
MANRHFTLHPFSAKTMLRKLAPYLVFIGLGLLFVFSQPLAYAVLYKVAILKGLSTLATDTAASPAEIWAEAQLDGWPTIGRATGKLIMAAAFFVLSSIFPWLMQKLTHPGPARWKVKLYTVLFDKLPANEQFAEASRVDNRAAFRMAISILAAALINCLVLMLLSTPAQAQVRRGAECLLPTSTARLKVREATGRNDGPDVELAQRLAGARVGIDPWCGCERYLWNLRCGRPSPKLPAAARNWSRPGDKQTFYIRGQRGVLDSLKIADTVTFFYTNLGRVGHVGMVVAVGRPIRAGRPARDYRVRAGNTGSGGGRDGAGVHDVTYSAGSIYAGSTW